MVCCELETRAAFACGRLAILVGPDGFERSTCGLKVRCTTTEKLRWRSGESDEVEGVWLPRQDSNLWPAD
jgi:hypothetical protein